MPGGHSFGSLWCLLVVLVVLQACGGHVTSGQPWPRQVAGTTLVLSVTQNATVAECTVTDPLSNTTSAMCGLESCPCADIQPAIDSASLLLDIALEAPPNATSIVVMVWSNGSSSAVNVDLPTTGTAEVLVGPGVYEGANNTQLHILRHSISITGSSPMEVVIAGALNVDIHAPVLLMQNSGICSITNIVFQGFGVSSEDSLSLIDIRSANVTMTNVTLTNLRCGLGSKTISVDSSLDGSALIVRDMTVTNSSLWDLFYTEAATNVDVEGLRLEGLFLNSFGKFVVPGHATLRLADVELLSVQQLLSSLRGYISVTFVGGKSLAYFSQFTLQSCRLADESFVQIFSSLSSSHMVQATDWLLDDHASKGILFDVAGADLVLERFTASNSTLGALAAVPSNLLVTDTHIANCAMQCFTSVGPTLSPSGTNWTIANSTFSQLQSSDSFVHFESARSQDMDTMTLTGVYLENLGPAAVIQTAGVSVIVESSLLSSNSQNFDIISLDSSSSFTLTDTTVIQSESSLRGDQVKGSLFMTNTTIKSVAICSAMTVTQGGVSEASVVVEGCVFEDYALVLQVPDVVISASHFVKSIPSVSSSQLVGSLLFSAGVESAVVSNCTFLPSHLGESNGATIAVGTPSSVTIDAGDSTMAVLISDCQFVNKTGYQGGALRADGGDIFVTDSVFMGCKANSGGAIFVTSGTLSMHSTQFFSNAALQFGGDMFVGGDARVFLDDLHMRFSTSESLGGSLYFESSATGLASGLKFFNCSASTGAALASAGESSVTFFNCDVRAGHALASGGGFSTHQDSVSTFYDCYFALNHARSYGAALFTSDRSQPVFSNCTIEHNRAQTSGGGIYSQDTSRIVVSNCTFYENRASSGGGAVMLAVDSFAWIADTRMVLNSANGVGGAISTVDRSRLIVNNGTFYENWSGIGGGLHFGQQSRAVLEHCYFGHHFTRSYGGACSMAGSTQVQVAHSVFEQNTAPSREGGAIAGTDFTTLTVTNCTFIGNNAGSGGAIFFEAAHELTIKESHFFNNSATDKGGAVRTGNSVLSYILDSVFTDNVSTGAGGAVFYGNTTAAKVLNSTFTSNTALSSGGALAGIEAAVRVEFSHFIANIATTSGGAVALYDSPDGRIFGSDFEDNNCTYGRGGAIYLDSLSVSVRHCMFERNSATFGGGLFMVLPFQVASVISQHSNDTFVDNFSLSDGGAVALGGSSVHSSGGGSFPTAAEEECPPEGYLLAAEAVRALFEDCRFVSNTAQGSGGALAVQDYAEGQLQLRNVSMEGNFAAHYGGAIFTRQPSGVGLLLNASLLYNSAAWGGSTIGFDRVTDVTETNAFACTNCTIELLPKQYAANIGYENSLGYATPPSTLGYADGSSCPNTLALNGEAISLTLGMRDGFSTPVYGQLFLSTSYSVSFNSTGDGCHVVSPPDSIRHINETGVACFDNITLEGFNNSTCTLEFSTDSLLEISVLSLNSDVDTEVTCVVALGGCLDGLVVEEGDTSDTCAEPPLWGAFLILGLVLILLLLTCLLLGVVLLHQYRERQRKIEEGYYEELEIDDILRETSLEDILNDPDIHRIPWKELELGERIGIGASGIVTAAHWTHDGETTEVALKELMLQFDEMEAEAVRNFIVEIKLMRALRHSRVVAFEGIAYHDGRLFLVTELMANGSVRDVLTKKGANCSFKLRTKFLYDAALGMVHLHSKKLIHRDLKPQNILVNRNWVCKIADFGVSTIKTNTCTMTAVGTPVYMAPEVLNNERYGEAVDSYSFGILMVEVYSGRRPYSDLNLNDAQLMFKIYHEHLRPSTEGLHPLVQQMVAETLNREPGLRPTFQEIVMRLKRLSKLEVDEHRQGRDSWELDDAQIRLSGSGVGAGFSLQEDESPV